ncbi:MAG: hypothetical protein N3C12_04035 [Candidatus Binatia bacterium]|nr:hypothetical protein [Candidatus Binatia bacterium]
MNSKHFWAVLSLLFAVGCGDDRENGPLSNPTASPTPTEHRLPSPTPTPRQAAHAHILIGSHHGGGGEIMAHFDFDQGAAELTEEQCLGGVGDSCEGGLIVYSGTSPAFETVGADEAEEHLQPLLPGTEVEIEIVEIDEGVRIQVEGTELSMAGSRALLGVAPFHTHVSWQLILPGGVDPATATPKVRLRLVAAGSVYDPSATYTLRLKVVDAGHDHE